MSYIWAVLVIVLLAAFNLYCMDSIMRMRSDIAVIRKSVRGLAGPAPAPGKAAEDGDDGGLTGRIQKVLQKTLDSSKNRLELTKQTPTAQ